MSVGQFVPFAGMLFILGVVIGPIWVRSHFIAKEREQLHQTLRTAFEKGQNVPPELVASLQSRFDGEAGGGYDRWRGGAGGDLRRGLVLMGVGVGIMCLGVGLYFGISQVSPQAGGITGGSVAGSGAIPFLIGVAFVISYMIRPKDQAGLAGDKPRPPFN
ncbi:MAG: DUF6249 domain-containing protein [Caulobacteraceae bacterium]